MLFQVGTKWLACGRERQERGGWSIADGQEGFYLLNVVVAYEWSV